MMYRHVQGTDGQFLGHPCAHGISHNFTGTLVLNASKIEPTFRRGDVVMSTCQTASGFCATKCCSSRFGATGNSGRSAW